MSVLISGPPEAIRGSKVDVARLRRCGERLLTAIGESGSELSVVLVDDPEISALNKRWRSRPQATDVLSFSQLALPVDDGPSQHPSGLLGDIVISVETAAKQAEERHRGLDETITRLLIHGLLHLVGHDHVDDDDATRMSAEERRLWRGLNT